MAGYDVKYEKQKEAVRQRQMKMSLAGRDIAPIPKVKNRERRETVYKSLKAFAETYFSATFYLKWSSLHLEIIRDMEHIINNGGLMALGIPRGFGKTTLCEVAAIWATFTGRVEMVALIGSDSTTAGSMMDSIKMELETNDLLLEDFPEIVYPIRRLDRIFQRASGQLLKGKPTYIQWTADWVVFPTVKKSVASGACIATAGMGGRIRGLKVKRPDGKTVRPTLVIIDDPQTDESARSPMQVVNRLSLINGAILNLAGPGKAISAFMPCTTIVPGDVADQLLDNEKNPMWRGKRASLVQSFPKNEEMWEEYRRIYQDALTSKGRVAKNAIKEATKFYKINQKKMDAGAKVLWREWFTDNELSAIQFAMNQRFRNEDMFWAEFQGKPLAAGTGEFRQIQESDIKVNGLPKGEVATDVNTITAFIDVHIDVLYYAVCGWCSGFTGYLIEYGTFPRQNRAFFISSKLQNTLRKMYVGSGVEGALYAGLENLVNLLIPNGWKMPDGSEHRIERCLIDANWGQSTDLVYKFCKQSPHSNVLMPSHGLAVGPAAVSLNQYKKRAGDKVGLHWRIPGKLNNRPVKHVVFDANYWKSHLQARIMTAMGDSGSFSIFGKDLEVHKLLVEHLKSEYKMLPKDERGTIVEVWKQIAGHENHWFDCIVGNEVAASMCGIHLNQLGDTRAPEKKSIRMSEMLRKRKELMSVSA